MTAAHNIDLPAVLAERLTTTHPDVLRELLATFIHTLMGAEAVQCIVLMDQYIYTAILGLVADFDLTGS